MSWNSQQHHTRGRRIQSIQHRDSFHDLIKKRGEFPPERDRYHLYVSYSCPWAHRTLIARVLKGLEDIISLSVCHYYLGDRGWVFESEIQVPGCIPDYVNNCTTLRQVYELADRGYRGRYTVPVLFDKKTKKIVNNDSEEIVRIFNSSFQDFCKNPQVDLSPEDLLPKIEELNEIINDGLNHGVYDAGFSNSQQLYEQKARLVADTLLRMENILKNSKFICGDVITETDIRLFVTTVRFDPVYYVHFKCNIVAVRDCTNLSRWMKRIFKMKGVRKTVNMEHIKKHYYLSQRQLNPSQLIPLSNGPLFDNQTI